jgi:hypothetical protein
MKTTMLSIACAAALALAAPAAFAKGGDDGRGDDHGQDAPAQVQKGNDDAAGHDAGDDKGQNRGRKAQTRRRGATPGACTGRGTSKLKANQPRNGRIQVEFEVESHVSGQVWTVQMNDNGASFFKGSKTTKAPGGSFEAKASAKNQAGADAISATATNSTTGETCTASVSV